MVLYLRFKESRQREEGALDLTENPVIPKKPIASSAPTPAIAPKKEKDLSQTAPRPKIPKTTTKLPFVTKKRQTCPEGVICIYPPDKSVLSYTKVDSQALRVKLEYQIIGDYGIAAGDIIVGEKADLTAAKSKNPSGKVVLTPPRLWEDGIIPFKLGKHKLKKAILEAMAYLNHYTNVQFLPRTDEASYIYFKSGKGCSSYVGKIGGAQPVILEANCKAGNVVHELMHVLGFFHEHMRPDRDEYIHIIWDNIVADKKSQFQKLPEAFTNISWPFDPHSIMMYGSKAFVKDNKNYSIISVDGVVYDQNRTGLTESDIDRVNALY